MPESTLILCSSAGNQSHGMRGNQRKNDASRACDTLLDSLNVLHEVNQRKLSEELFGACAVVVNDGLLSTLPSDVLSEIMQECRTNVGLIRDRKRLIWGNFDDVMGTKIALKEVRCHGLFYDDASSALNSSAFWHLFPLIML